MFSGQIVTYKSYLLYSEYGLQIPFELVVQVECGILLRHSESSKSKTNQTIEKGTVGDIEDEFFNNDTSMGQRKILCPRRESNPWPPRYQLGALTN